MESGLIYRQNDIVNTEQISLGQFRGSPCCVGAPRNHQHSGSDTSQKFPVRDVVGACDLVEIPILPADDNLQWCKARHQWASTSGYFFEVLDESKTN